MSAPSRIRAGVRTESWPELEPALAAAFQDDPHELEPVILEVDTVAAAQAGTRFALGNDTIWRRLRTPGAPAPWPRRRGISSSRWRGVRGKKIHENGPKICLPRLEFAS